MNYLELIQDLDEKVEFIKKRFHHTSDLIIREITCNCEQGLLKGFLLYVDGIVKAEAIQEFIVAPIVESENKIEINDKLIDNIMENIINSINVKKTKQFKEIYSALVNGKTVLLLEGYDIGILADTGQWEGRSIEEPYGERSPRGPIVGLTEKLKSNINLLRSAIKTPDLLVETIEKGEISSTSISIVYIEGVVDKGILEKVKRRIKSLKLKYILNARVVEEVLEGRPRTFFSLIRVSDRLDGVVSSLYEGRVVVLVDGYPHACITPALFVEFFQAPDEYHSSYGSLFIRMLRFGAFLIAVYLPAAYIAIANFHKKDLPDKLSKALITKDELLPTFWEIFILYVLIRLLLDITYRVPKSSVILISLIGTAVIGETAVSAKLIHPVSLIITGLTTLCSILISNKGLGTADSVLRTSFLLIAYFFGFNGMIIGTTILIIYMVNLKSLGVPYLSPLIPFKMEEFKDTIIRGNLEKLINSKHSYLNKGDSSK